MPIMIQATMVCDKCGKRRDCALHMKGHGASTGFFGAGGFTLDPVVSDGQPPWFDVGGGFFGAGKLACSEACRDALNEEEQAERERRAKERATASTSPRT